MTDSDEIGRRKILALSEIRRLSESDDGEQISLFVNHHQEELGDDYWTEYCNVCNPSQKQILDLLELQDHWSEDDDEGLDTFDFTLPGDVTSYLISVTFNQKGNVEEINMES